MRKVEEKDVGAYLCAEIGEPGRKRLATLDRVELGSPADRAGLATVDQLVAIDELRVYGDDARRHIHALEPGTRHTLTIYRGNRVLQKRVALGKKGRETYRVVSVENPTQSQLEVRKAWLGI